MHSCHLSLLSELLSFIILTTWNFQRKRIYLLAAPLLIAYCEWSLSLGFIGLNFLLFLNDILHTFAQAESGCSWELWCKKQVFWLILPLSWHFRDPWSGGLISCMPFSPSSAVWESIHWLLAQFRGTLWGQLEWWPLRSLEQKHHAC